jgi:hypothetical protein
MMHWLLVTVRKLACWIFDVLLACFEERWMVGMFVQCNVVVVDVV